MEIEESVRQRGVLRDHDVRTEVEDKVNNDLSDISEEEVEELIEDSEPELGENASELLPTAHAFKLLKTEATQIFCRRLSKFRNII